MTMRLGCFFGVLALMGVWEIFSPRRKRLAKQTQRWTTNLLLVLIDVLVVRLLLPITAIELAQYTQQHHLGLFSQLPFWIATILSVIVLDFIIYLQHIMFHSVPILWRLHMVHHADLDFDVTTGVRFHPLEILISMGIKFSAIYLLGITALGFFVFEVLLNATAMFNHSNIRLPIKLDRILRLFIVTPDMHRIHHSILTHETNRNFGFNLPIWDWLCGTYRAQPTGGHEKMTIGLPEYQHPVTANLSWVLSAPFFKKY